MLRLTDYENRMLNGDEGKLKQKAMEVIVRYANVLDAAELCEVTKAHLHCGFHHYLRTVRSENIDEIMAEMFFCSSEKLVMNEVCCDCFADVGRSKVIRILCALLAGVHPPDGRTLCDQRITCGSGGKFTMGSMR